MQKKATPCTDKDSEKQVLTFSESIATGMITGITTTLVHMPIWTLSTRAQQNLPLTTSPLILYRGILTQLTTMAPSIALRIAATGAIERAIKKPDSHTISPEQRMLTSFIGGASTSIFSNATTLIITQQHKHNNSSFIQTMKCLIRKNGLLRLTSGLPASMIFDGLFIFSFYGLIPTIQKHIEKHALLEESNSTTIKVITNLATGTSIAALTHLPARIKTYQHNAADSKKNKLGMLSALQQMIREGGYRSLLRGLSIRAPGLPLTIFAASEASRICDNYIKGQRSKA